MDSNDAFVIVAAPVVDLVAGLVAEAVACTAVLEAAACWAAVVVCCAFAAGKVRPGLRKSFL